MFRAAIRFLGLICMTSAFVISGLHKITDASMEAVQLSKTSFPYMMVKANVSLSAHDYVLIEQAVGALYVIFSLFIILGVGRAFFSFLLALLLTLVTVAYHVDINSTRYIQHSHILPFLKNLSMIGGLLFVAGSGRRSRRYQRALANPAAMEKKRN